MYFFNGGKVRDNFVYIFLSYFTLNFIGFLFTITELKIILYFP